MARGVSGIVAAALLILILIPALALVMTSLVEYGKIQRQLVELEARRQQLALEVQRGVVGSLSVNETADAGVLTITNTLPQAVTISNLVVVFEDWRASLITQAVEEGVISVTEASITCGSATYNVTDLRSITLGPGCSLLISFHYTKRPVSATLLTSVAAPGGAEAMPGAVAVAIALTPSAPAAPSPPPSPGWLTGCACRLPLHIKNPSGYDLEGYPVKIEISESMLNASLSELTPNKIRFTDSDGVTLLPFWFEEWDPSEGKAVAWVKLSIHSGETKTIYIYYFCDESLPSGPNPHEVFTFFDDFSANPTTSGRWRVYRYSGSEFTWDPTTKTVTLTSTRSQGVAAFMNVDLLHDLPSWAGWHLHFYIYIDGVADGVALGFYKDEAPYQAYGRADYGGSLAMNAWDSSASTWVRSRGYVLEFDIYQNTGEPSTPHIAIISTYETPAEGGSHDLVGPHYGLVAGFDYRGAWWAVDVYFYNRTLKLYLNGTLVLEYYNETLFAPEYGGIAIGAGTGGEKASQLLKGPIYLRPWIEEEPYLVGWGSPTCTTAPTPAPTVPWLEGWQYRVPLTIYNSMLYDLSDYQLKLVFTPENFTYSKAKSDGSDLRFTLEDGVTLLDYWIEKWEPGGTSIVWVKVPSLPAQQNVTIYMYYGNPSASFDPEHHGLTKVMERLPAADGPGYTIQYEVWIMDRSYFDPYRGTAQGWHADDGCWTLHLLFAFPYYDSSYNRVYVCSNGFVGTTYARADYTSTERELKSRGMIAVLWADLRTDRRGGDIYVDNNYEDVYGRGVYIRWKTTFYYSSGTQQFAVVLYQNGLIRMDYDGVTGSSLTDSSIIVGVSKGDSTHFTVVYGDGGVPPSQLNTHPSIMLWPRKKALSEPTVFLGEEEVYS